MIGRRRAAALTGALISLAAAGPATATGKRPLILLARFHALLDPRQLERVDELLVRNNAELILVEGPLEAHHEREVNAAQLKRANDERANLSIGQRVSAMIAAFQTEKPEGKAAARRRRQMERRAT